MIHLKIELLNIEERLRAYVRTFFKLSFNILMKSNDSLPQSIIFDTKLNIYQKMSERLLFRTQFCCYP